MSDEDDVVEVVVRDNGSLRITGNRFVIKDGQGKPYDLGGRTSIGLCRCGRSQDMPFCDGQHKQCGFQSVVLATTLPPKKA